MYSHKHTDFILTPISTIIDDVLFAVEAMQNGINSEPSKEYMFQSIFLKMTGFQEQKLKCICWEFATNDYKYRYDRYSAGARQHLGEGSSEDDKKLIYTDLYKKLESMTSKTSIDSIMNTIKEEARNATVDYLNSLNGTLLQRWNQKGYSSCLALIDNMEKNCYAFNKKFFFRKCDECHKDPMKAAPNKCAVSVKGLYEDVFEQRNRCAHNLTSYQTDLPSLMTMAEKSYDYKNYFVRYAVLMWMDNIYTAMFKEYLRLEGRTV